MRLLLVDDDQQFRMTASRRFRRQGHHVCDAACADDALELVRKETFDVSLIDLVMPGMNGLELLAKLKELEPHCEVVMFTGDATVETAVAAMKQGAFDYLKKPSPFEELEALLVRAYEHHQLARENLQLREALVRSSPRTEIIGDSPIIRNVLKTVEKAAVSDSPVLILGESGTGKELVARALHRLGRRADKPLVTINCAALQESLLESELFGHEKGSFTGATVAKMGLFEVADGGTLFIDELGELAGGLQAKLLRVLEDGSLRRVGATKEKHVEVRVVAATNKNLADEVKAGRFRDDLYFRLNVLPIELPPLRVRREDIPLLTDHFLRRFGCGEWEVSDAATSALRTYDWPGNIRELANVIERATILAESPHLDLEDLPEQIRQKRTDDFERPTCDAIGTALTLEELEHRHVARILAQENWSKVRTADVLGINRRSLYRLIQKYGLKEPDDSRQQ